MSNPDRGNFNSIYAAVPAGFVVVMTVVLIFKFNDISFPTYLLWIGIPVLCFILASLINFISQHVICDKIDAQKALLGGLPAVGTALVGLGLASISYCRIPVVSVFAPFYVNDTEENADGTDAAKKCCAPKLMLEKIEQENPGLKGISYAFYLFFSILFGVVVGNSMATVCI